MLSSDLCLKLVRGLLGGHVVSRERPYRGQVAGGAGPHPSPLRADASAPIFPGRAAFAKPGVYEYLEEQRVFYSIRLPSNEVLDREIQHPPKRPAGRPPKKTIVSYYDFRYQARSWDRPQRVVAGVEWH